METVPERMTRQCLDSNGRAGSKLALPNYV
jgi:hypothetical protein